MVAGAGAKVGFDADLTGVGDFGRDMLRFGPALSRAMWEGATEAADILQRELELEFADSPGGHPWAQARLRSPSGGTVYLNTTDDIPGYRERGVLPHPIHPIARESGRLVFWWAKKSRWFVGRPGQHVNHPGQKAHPFFLRRTTTAQPLMKDAFDEAVGKALGSSTTGGLT